MVATVFTANPALNADDVNNQTSFRIVCTLAAASNGSLQVTIQPGTTNNLTISHASIGKWSGSGANTTATPLELKYGGASGFSNATTAQLSDLLDHSVATNGATGFSLASGDKVVVIYDIVNQGTSHASQRYNGAATNADTFYKVPGTSWNSNSSTGFTQLTGYNFAVAKVETNSASTAYTLTASGGSYAVTGTAATLRRARLLGASAGSYALTGTAATLRRGVKLAADAGSYALTGTAATFRRTRILPAASGSYALTGSNATLRRGLVVAATAGAYAITGTAATLRHGYAVGATGGSYSLSGSTATLRKTWLLSAAAGSYAITGTAATLTKVAAYKLAANAGSYAVSGSTASLILARRLSAAAGSYGLTGTAATLVKLTNGVLSAGAGSYALSGQAATLRATRKLVAASSSYAISGQSATLRLAKKLSAVAGSYAVTGNTATLTKSGLTTYTLTAEPGSYFLAGQPATLTYLPLPGIRNPLERLKMYTGSMGSVSNREDWIVNISLVGDDGTSFDLTGANIVTYVCREGNADCPVLSASLNSGIVLTDDYTMQWHFTEEQMAGLCPQQYDVFCRVERDDITTQLLAANVAIVDGGPQ